MLNLWVIVATDGRVVATGAAGAFLELGLFLLLVGSTGVGLRDLTADRCDPAKGRLG